MKIDRLDLKAFGCFTDVSLDFSGAGHGTFVIYGPNEAGKTTALQGVRQWLYEFERGVALEFKHKKTKQRVGGVVSANGQRLGCFRKRGNANTLVDEHDTPIGDDALRALLKGIDENRFRTIFGINHSALREGGQDIAAGKGDLGQALFAAGSGLLRLDRLQKRLEEETDLLFAVRGEKPRINNCLSRCKEIEDKADKARLSLAEVTQNKGTLEDLERQREGMKTALADLQQHRESIDRLIRVTPLVHRRNALLERVESVRDAICLREAFRKEFQEIDKKLLSEESGLEGLQHQQKALERELTLIASDPVALGERETLQKLALWAAQYKTDYDDWPALKTQHNQIQGEAKQKLRELGREPNLAAEQIEPLRLDDQKRERVRKLGTQRAEFVTKVEGARGKVSELEGELHTAKVELEQLAKPADTEGLSATLNRVTKMGDLEKECVDAEKQLTDCERTVKQAHSRLVLWSGDLNAILLTPIPSAQEVDLHRDLIEEARQRADDAAERVSEHQTQRIDLEKQLERLLQTGVVPSEQDLETERSRRHRGWRLIRSAWLEGKGDESAERDWAASFVPEASLPEAFEMAVTRTDQVADRLRREATRISEHARLLAEQTATEDKLEAAKGKLEKATAALVVTEGAWKAIWKPAEIEPRSPKEMREWLDKWQKLVQLAQNRQAEADRLGGKKKILDDAIRDLRSALDTSGGLPASLRPDPSLGELLEVANRRVREADDLRRRHDTLKADLQRITPQLEKNKRAFEESERKKVEWEQEWDAALRFLEPEQRLLPDEANRTLDTIFKFWQKYSDLKKLHFRIEGIEERSGGFPSEVFELAERVEGKRPEGEEPLRVHERLQTRLRLAEKNEDRRQEEQQKNEELLEKIADKNQGVQLLQQQLHRLCQEAHVRGSDELPEAIRRSDERREVETKLQECESDLQRQGGMADLNSLSRLVEEAEQRHQDNALEIAAAADRIEEKRTVLEELNKQIGAAEETRRALRSRPGAGELAAERESEYACLRSLTEEYVALKLASRTLKEAIRRYREGKSSGLLSEASSIFRLLTCKAFDRLAISEDDEETPYMVGVRPDDSEVRVVGMSDGTCDQLYLALRLAHLKRHATKDGPFPFIVDDILLTFDNDRTKAALRCLADLGQHLQVLFFTHHLYIRDMAADPEFADSIVIRDLP